MAVVVSGEFDHFVTTRCPPGDPDCTHRGLGPTADQSNFLDTWNGLDDLFGKHRLGLRRGPRAGPFLGGSNNRFDHLGVGMSEDHRSPRSDVIDQPTTIDVEKIGSLGVINEQGRSADCPERASWTVHAAGHQMASPFEGGGTLGSNR